MFELRRPVHSIVQTIVNAVHIWSSREKTGTKTTEKERSNHKKKKLPTEQYCEQFFHVLFFSVHIKLVLFTFSAYTFISYTV